MKSSHCLFPLLIVGLVLSWSVEAETPSHGLLMPYANHWRAQDYKAVDLLSLLRCDLARWKDHSTSTSPMTLGGFAMTYDAHTKRVVLFYGINDIGGSLLSETWVWDGSSWTETHANGPSGRFNEAMIYDASSQAVLLFGGQGGETYTSMFGETWSWDGSVWTELHPTEHPTARAGHAMAFDALRGEVVLFGGDENDSTDMQGPYLNDTWIWDGTDWELQTPLNSPIPRFRLAMAYDTNRGKVVLFGGHGEEGPLDDTWEWDGTNWTQITTAHTPDNRRGHGMAYDSRRGKVVLFGGELGEAFSLETWEYDGVDWTQIEAANPPVTDALALAYDVDRGETVLFTGEQPDATFVYDGEPSCPE
jgi:hypothetical protein